MSHMVLQNMFVFFFCLLFCVERVEGGGQGKLSVAQDSPLATSSKFARVCGSVRSETNTNEEPRLAGKNYMRNDGLRNR